MLVTNYDLDMHRNTFIKTESARNFYFDPVLYGFTKTLK
jgi:hypothetical protein